MKNKRWGRIIVILLIAGVAAGTAVGDEIGVFIAGVRVKKIYRHRQDKTAAGAARDLHDYLIGITGHEIPVEAVEGPLEEDGIFVGSMMLPEAEKNKAALPSANGEWFASIARPGRLYLFGNDRDKYIGTVWAVSDFLERSGGVRWLWPGKLGEVVPKKERIDVPEGTIIESPRLQMRCWTWVSFGYNNYRTLGERRDLPVWTRDRMRFGSSLPGYKGSMGFGHAFGTLMPRENYGREHPEYYSLVSPENWIGAVKPMEPTRTAFGGAHWQLCTGNKEVRKIIADKIISLDSPTIHSISPNDGYMFCECELCRASDPVRWRSIFENPDLSNRIFEFAADIATQVGKRNPGAKVGIFSYSFFSNAPTSLKSLPDNLIISMTYIAGEFRDPAKKKAFEDRVEGFSRLGAKFVGREYWGTHYYCNMPWLHTKLLAENLKFIYDRGAVGIYGEGGNDWANNALNYYLLSKMMWNPNLKREDVIDDFCRHGFGEAAESMRKYFDFMEGTLDKWYADRMAAGLPFRDGYAGRMENFVDIYTPEVLKNAGQLLSAASKKAAAPEDRERVEFFRIGLGYAELFVKTIRAYRKAAACGLNMVFITPEDGIYCIDDAMLARILNDAEKSQSQLGYYLAKYHGLNALDLGRYLYIGQTVHMSWERIVQDQKLALRQGYFNYLVNGAFEYDHGWDYKTLKGNAGAGIELSTSHDSFTNNMAQFHGRQGRSLKIVLESGGEFAAASKVRVLASPGTLWKVEGFYRDDSGRATVQALVEWDDGSAVGTLNLERRNDEVIKEKNGWQEIRFRPFTVPSRNNAKMRLILKVINSGDGEAVVFLDDFKILKSH